MKQIEQNYRSGKLAVEEVPAPMMLPGTLLVQTSASLISSGTERQLVSLAKASLAGKAMARPDLVRKVLRNVGREGLWQTLTKVSAKLDTPIAMGYSLAGKVVQAGRDSGGLRAGDRVACAGAGFASHAELNAVPRNLVARIPDGVSDEQASFVALGAIALQAVRQASPLLGERVVVTGLGLLGLLCVQLLKANGCRVLGFDPDRRRAALALELGADQAVSDGLERATAAFTDGAGADAVIVCASAKSSEPVNLAAEISRLKGRVVVLGMVGLDLDRDAFYRRELDLRLSMSYGPGRYDPDYEEQGRDYPLAYVRWTEQRNMEAFLQLVADGRVTPEVLVSHRFPIEDGAAAYDIVTGGQPHLAVLLTYSGAADPARAVLRAEARAAASALSVGFIGLGNYARSVLLPAVRKVAGADLRTVVTATGLTAHHVAAKYGFAAAATDSAVVLDDPGINIVFVATRHDTHAAYAAAALRAGKSVFCEKPMALGREELAEVAAAAADSPGILTVGFNRRFAPLVDEMREALRARTGPLLMAYRVNAGSVAPDSWIRGQAGGGRILGEVCHFVDLMSHLCASSPVEAYAIAGGGQEDAVSIQIRFADGSAGSILYSSLGDPAAPKEHLDVFAAGTVLHLSDFVRLDIFAGGRRRVVKQRQDKGQSRLVAAFLDAVKTGKHSPTPLAELVAVTAATFAIEASLLSGQPEPI